MFELTPPERARRKEAMVKVKAALRSGNLEKPDVCDNCSEPPVANSKLYAYFRYGYGYYRWRNVEWLCFPCFSVARPPHYRMGRSPSYPEMRRLLVTEGLSYQQVADRFGIASVSSMQETFKRRCVAAGDVWPIPELQGRFHLKGWEQKGTRHRDPKFAVKRATPCSGLARELNDVMNRYCLTTRDVSAVAGIRYQYIADVLSGARKQILHERYRALDKAIETLTEQHSGFEERADDLRERVRRHAYGRQRWGLQGLAKAAHLSTRRCYRFMAGRPVPVRLLDQIEEAVEKWEAEDGVLR